MQPQIHILNLAEIGSKPASVQIQIAVLNMQKNIEKPARERREKAEAKARNQEVEPLAEGDHQHRAGKEGTAGVDLPGVGRNHQEDRDIRREAPERQKEGESILHLVDRRRTDRQGVLGAQNQSKWLRDGEEIPKRLWHVHNISRAIVTIKPARNSIMALVTSLNKENMPKWRIAPFNTSQIQQTQRAEITHNNRAEGVHQEEDDPGDKLPEGIREEIAQRPKLKQKLKQELQ